MRRPFVRSPSGTIWIPALIFAVIRTESNFRERAESGAGAKGLMQITDRTAEYIASSRGIEAYDLFCAEDNLDFGCWYLRYLFDRFPDERTALAAYNAGEGDGARLALGRGALAGRENAVGDSLPRDGTVSGKNQPDI